MSKLGFQFHYKRHLPHIQPPGATFFVTFRLAGTIPTAVRHRLQEKAAHTDAILNQIDDPQERKRRAYQAQRRLFGRWDAVLDAAELARIRRYVYNNPVKAGLVADADAWPSTYCRWLR